MQLPSLPQDLGHRSWWLWGKTSEGRILASSLSQGPCKTRQQPQSFDQPFTLLRKRSLGAWRIILFLLFLAGSPLGSFFRVDQSQKPPACDFPPSPDTVKGMEGDASAHPIIFSGSIGPQSFWVSAPGEAGSALPLTHPAKPPALGHFVRAKFNQQKGGAAMKTTTKFFGVQLHHSS